MKLLCDENIPLNISEYLSSKHKVVNISQKYPGIQDEEVYKIAYKARMCIVTSDHHFDKYRNRKNYGIIRLNGNLKTAGESLSKVLSEYRESVENTYIKISNDGYSVFKNRHSKAEKRLRKRSYKFS